MESKKRIYLLIMAFLLAPCMVNAEGGEITSIQIVQDTLACTLNNQCSKWKITGLCFWLDCDPFCSVNTTLKVDHYSPDLVISVYRQEKSNAWKEANTLVDPAAHIGGQQQTQSLLHADMGQGNQSATRPTERDNHFKEVDVIGNPTLTFFRGLSSMYLPSQASPWLPYYLSMADAYQWRSPLIEMGLHPIDSLTPGRRIIGPLLNNWGSVFPRTGFINQPSDPKTAAVIAQRAADIVTAQNTPSTHVGQRLSSPNCGDNCSVKDIKETDANSALWQMVYPISEKKCDIFGTNDFPGKPWQQEALEKGHGNYVWVLWRHYQGCIPGDGEYLRSI